MSSVLSTSLKGASLLILVQVLSRGLTFVINQGLLRFLSPELLGASAQLELYYLTCIYFSRDCVRVAQNRHSGAIQGSINFAYIALILSVFFSNFLAYIYARSSSMPDVPNMLYALKLYGAAIIMELATEPAFAVSAQKMMFKTRAAAETCATISRCLGTFGAVLYFKRAGGEEAGVLPFAVGQMAYAAALVVVYYLNVLPVVSKEPFSLLPRQMQNGISSKENGAPSYLLFYFPRPLCNLALTLYLHSGFKYLITQGDSFVIAAVASLADQGAFALASNYGSLIARVLFQPIEESSRGLFARLCAPAPAPTTSQTATRIPPSTSDIAAPPSKSNASAPTPSKPDAGPGPAAAFQTYATILHLYSLLALLSASLGPHLARPLLSLVAGPRFASPATSAALAAFAFYIPLLAANGITEAFIAAVATPAQIRRQTGMMAVWFGIFAAALFFGLDVGSPTHAEQRGTKTGAGGNVGARGLVLANCASMACRLAWGLRFVPAWFRARGVRVDWWEVVPSMSSIAAAGAAAAVLGAGAGKDGWRNQVTEMVGRDPFGELIAIGAVAGVLVAAIAVGERDFLLKAYRMVKPRG